MVRNTGDNRYGTPTWIVDADISKGTHITIQGAIDDSSSGDTILVHPGVYTEDLTLIAGITIYGVAGVLGNEAIITGKVTQTATGNTLVRDLRFVSNGDVVVDIGGAGGIATLFRDCAFFYSDDTCITINNASSSLGFKGCTFNQTAASLAIVVSTTGGATFTRCGFFDNGQLAGAPSIAAGALRFKYCEIQGQSFSTSASANIFFQFCHMDSNKNITHLTTAGTGTSEIINTFMDSGTSTAIVIGAGTTVRARTLSIETSNGTPVSITGTFNTSYNFY